MILEKFVTPVVEISFTFGVHSRLYSASDHLAVENEKNVS